METRPIFKELMARAREPRQFIQVMLGPRQVGKTTLALQVAEKLRRPCHYISADTATLQDLSWLEREWLVAREMVPEGGAALLIIDEAQKIPNWSEMIKKLWDEDSRRRINLGVMILGSSPWLMQRGMTESLAGRFEVIPITHWSYTEMRDHFGWSLDDYLYFGGYPGAATRANREDVSRWTNYIIDSLVEMTISRDILLMTQVNKPHLLRRLFQLGCVYSGQILSYQKMLGQLQDAGNTTTLAHYLDLLEGASLVTGIPKYAQQPVRRKGSSPRLAVYNTALMTAQSNKTFQEAKENSEYWGRLVESAVGAHLLNGIRGTQIELTYWREGDREVDFVLRRGDSLTAIEVKSNHGRIRPSAIDKFVQSFKPNRILLVGNEGIPLERFLQTPIPDLLA